MNDHDPDRGKKKTCLKSCNGHLVYDYFGLGVG